jgi:hypothetical protein
VDEGDLVLRRLPFLGAAQRTLIGLRELVNRGRPYVF